MDATIKKTTCIQASYALLADKEDFLYEILVRHYICDTLAHNNKILLQKQQ